MNKYVTVILSCKRAYVIPDNDADAGTVNRGIDRMREREREREGEKVRGSKTDGGESRGKEERIQTEAFLREGREYLSLSS